jgi:hypothetical protein
VFTFPASKPKKELRSALLDRPADSRVLVTSITAEETVGAARRIQTGPRPEERVVSAHGARIAIRASVVSKEGIVEGAYIRIAGIAPEERVAEAKSAVVVRARAQSDEKVIRPRNAQNRIARYVVLREGVDCADCGERPVERPIAGDVEVTSGLLAG